MNQATPGERSGHRGPVERILLVGMMGVGKSTTGRAAAGRLGWSYADSDQMVEQATGRTVEELWQERGEPAFRSEESRVLAEALQAPGPSVISVAGGAVLDPGNRRLIRAAGLVVWLRCGVETIAQRVHPGDGRPLLRGDTRQVLEALELVRRPLYEEVADEVVDVDGQSPAAVADRVVAMVTPRPAEPDSGPGPRSGPDPGPGP